MTENLTRCDICGTYDECHCYDNSFYDNSCLLSDLMAGIDYSTMSLFDRAATDHYNKDIANDRDSEFKENEFVGFTAHETLLIYWPRVI